MNPDSYIPFYGADFFQAVEGLPDHIALGYLRAIWHYWRHTHCSGLRNETEFLRKVCRIEVGDWTEAREIIFDGDKYFSLGEDGKWHQNRAAEEWKKSSAAYMAKVLGGQNRWKTKTKKKK